MMERDHGLPRRLRLCGAAERFIRTLKEQAVYGVCFENEQEVRDALVSFAATYNRHWLVEKLGHRSPLTAREDDDILRAA
mgnify:CR=1 FL=1